MEEIINMNIKDLKISVIGWTSIYTHNTTGDIKCILIKKNLFKGYSIIDSNGDKTKIDNLIDYNDSVVISHSKKMFVSKANVVSENTALEVKNKMYKKVVDDLYQKQQEVTNKENEKKDLEMAHAKAIEDIKREQSDEIYRKISYLSEPLKNIAPGKMTEEGTSISYEKPNELQISIGRTLGNMVRKPYKKEFEYKADMKQYLEALKKVIAEQYKPDVVNLQSLLNRLTDLINELKENYTEDLYIQTVALEAIFTTKFSNLIIECWQQYKDNDIYYYSESENWLQNDEKKKETNTIKNLIKSGKEACINLREKIIGQDDKHWFLNMLVTIDKLSETSSSDEVKEYIKKYNK